MFIALFWDTIPMLNVSSVIREKEREKKDIKNCVRVSMCVCIECCDSKNDMKSNRFPFHFDSFERIKETK